MSEITISKKEYKLLIELYAKKFKTSKLGYTMCSQCEKAKPSEEFRGSTRWCTLCKRKYHATYQRSYYTNVGKAKRQERRKEAEEEEEKPKKKKKSTSRK